MLAPSKADVISSVWTLKTGERLRLLGALPARLARHGIPAPAMSGRIITDDATTLRRKLFGALITGTLGATAGSTPVLREALTTAVRDLPRTADLVTLLEGPVPTKALTLMRLSPERPGDIWAELPTPLR